MNVIAHKFLNNLGWQKFLDFFIITFFITNVWIILYIKVLDYLNFLFPAHLSETFFRSGLGNPEPFEIPLYIIFSLFFVGIIWFYYRLSKGLNIPFLDNSLIKAVFALFLLILFINKLGVFPLKGDIFPYQQRINQGIYLIMFFLILAIIVFITIQAFIFARISKNKKILSLMVGTFLTIFIGILVFTPRFDISLPNASFFYGPIYEVASGKTIFTQASSQYGFLSILLMALFYNITHVNFAFLPILIWLLYILQYLLCFFLLYKTSRSIPFSLLGIFSIILINYLASPTGPQAGPIRWFPLFLTIFLLDTLKTPDNKLLLFVIPLFSLWNIDSGIALMTGYLFTLFLLFLSQKISLKKYLLTLVALILFSIAITGSLEIIHVALGLQPINFFKLYHSVRKYALVGEGMVPIEPHTYFWFVMLVYFSSLIYCFRNVRNGLKPFPTILFSANLMLFASIYYVGRSMPDELYTISPFMLFTLLLLLASFYKRSSTKLQISMLFCIFFVLIAFPLFKRKEYITEKILERYQKFSEGQIFRSNADELSQKKYGKEKDFILNNIKENDVLMLSPDDTYLFYLIKKRNLLDANPAWGSIQIQSELEPASKRVRTLCPQKIVVDCTFLQKCPAYKTLTGGDQNAFPLLLSEIEKSCKVEYKESICSDKLCIAEKK